MLQERERETRERVQKKMSLQQADTLLQSRKKWSFSFRRSSAGERQEVAKSEEEAARVQKAAAWQWYTRGVGEAVAPTKRPPVAPSQPPIHDINNHNVLQKKAPLAAAESPRSAASRFKAESADGARLTPSADPNSTPHLYDEFELSGLRTQMAHFVQRLQFHPQSKDNYNQSSAQTSKISVDHGRRHSKVAPSVAAASVSSDHQLTKPPPSRPFSALHRLVRKVVSRSIIKNTKNSRLIPNSLPTVSEEDTPYHFHHYIHHHHHHYHYGQSPAATIRSRGRRHSESSGIHPHIPSLLEEESDEEEEDVERSSIEAYLTRRRRHSDSFACHLTPQRASFNEEEEMKGGSAKEELPQRYDSEKLMPSKIPTMVSKDLAQPAGDEFDEEFPEIGSRRRHSAENLRERTSLERKAEGGGGTIYKLGGAADGAMAARPVRRRHSEEGFIYEMRKCTPSANRANTNPS